MQAVSRSKVLEFLEYSPSLLQCRENKLERNTLVYNKMISFFWPLPPSFQDFRSLDPELTAVKAP